MTPFENVLRISKQAEMLIEQAFHNWYHPDMESPFYHTSFYVYYGGYIGITEEAAQMIFKLFQEVKELTCDYTGFMVEVKCTLEQKEKDWIRNGTIKYST